MRRENTAQSMSQHAFTQFELSKYVLNNLSQFNLKPTTKLVLLYLCDCYNPKHGEMFPKQSTIAMKLGISEVSVIRAIQELHKEGLLISERKYTNRYKFTSKIVYECPENLIDVTKQKDTLQPIKKQPLYREQKRGTKKEHNKQSGGNVYSTEDYIILKDYAIKHNAQNINAYIAKLKQTGSAQSILKDYRAIESKKRYMTNNTIQTLQAKKEAEMLAVPPTQAWLELKGKLLRGRE